ncbi:MAG TPA: glutamate synthase subunit alpha, partial [Thermomicrobiales bacterium]|nr:glutamate synthase subunit alpha [Thermomicrobiales bacterium]
MHASSRQIAPLYDPAFERDACGVGLVVDIAGRRSRAILDRALSGIVNLTHRGGVGADARTGDGAGILTQIPFDLFAGTLAEFGADDVGPGDLGVAMTFLPTDDPGEAACRAALESAMAGQRLRVLGWRPVPIRPEVLGQTALASLPRIAQLLVARPAGLDEEEFERALFLARRASERAATAAGYDENRFFVVS